jgi:hypothetical protein
MNGLFPIIRRKRRPLVAEDHPLPPVNTEPVKVLADGQQTEQPDKSKSSNGENVSKPEAE